MKLSEKWLPSPLVTAMMAVFFGTLMDASVRYVNESVDLFALAFWRFAFATLFVSVPFFLSRRRLPGWAATRFHALRGLIHALATTLFFFALSRLELAVVTTLGFTAALLIVPVAWLMLKERPAGNAVLAAGLGFVGVTVTFAGSDLSLQFTAEEIQGLVAVLGAAFFYAISVVMLRKRAADDGAFAVTVYANFFPSVFLAVPNFALADQPDFGDIPILCMLGFFGMMIWVLMTSAYSRAPAQKLAPTEYTALLWSAVIGWLVFDEVPTLWVWAGAGITISACVIVSRKPRTLV
ncbi:DMT family transporter [Ponticaulis sp.]|uniref:DMT family transporter n=1 Tax=Ponticaulis sp. TaxID=2020902 RepID=UPI0025F3AAC2|nr:DMT family transporter [Ponticaulis sp.]